MTRAEKIELLDKLWDLIIDMPPDDFKYDYYVRAIAVLEEELSNK